MARVQLLSGVELVYVPRGYNDPEYQCLNGHLTATLRIDGEMYVFETEHSGNRGTYPQWSKNWVSKPISADGKEIPNTYKCGSRYWNEHCWFQLGKFESLEEVVSQVRGNAAEIARRAADEKHHAG
jgi:hypothetical protein